MPLPALLIAAYLVGSLPFGLYIGKTLFNKDLRDLGSHNTGASNAWRELGPVAGTCVFALDLAKGLVPVILARHYFVGNALAIVGAGFAAILGHTISIFLKFKGGKGVATSLGVAFSLSWMGGLIAFATWGVLLAQFRYISVASIIATAVGAVLIFLINGHGAAYGIFGLIATVFVLVKHIPNIKRLMRGEEPKVRFGKKAPTE